MTCTVAIIGCGPAGMFFLHALALRRQKLIEEGNEEAIKALPQVTCFERSGSPGGVWRADRNASETNMYEALWTNGAKEAIEFPDYTFDEHFKRALPMYMPREHILDYIFARCTRNNPTFFDNVKFNTSVKSVKYSDEKQKFVIQTIDLKSQSESEEFFDKCIWAAGDNGKPYVPKRISNILSSGGFKGDALHSCVAGNDFDKLVEGKKILFVGDSYSAEDLALQAIKLGVKKVHVLSRSGWGVVCGTKSWPRDCVRVHEFYEITGVSSDGRGIVIENKQEDVEMTLKDIDTVIYSTGYSGNFDMLDPSLRLYDENDDEEPNYFKDYEGFEKFKNDFKMKKNHMTEVLGDVPLGEITDYWMTHPGVYRGHLMSNPNMMFYLERVDAPLFDIDIQSWLLLAHITGDLSLPSVKEMKEFNMVTFADELQDPYVRTEIDANYEEAWEESSELEDDDHWFNQWGNERSREMDKFHAILQYRIMARDAADAKYPLDLGTYDELNEKGKALVEIDLISFAAHQTELVEGSTFRDYIPKTVLSVMTGTKAVPLKRPWLKLEGESLDDICGNYDGIAN